jgi:hypothetical protein
VVVLVFDALVNPGEVSCSGRREMRHGTTLAIILRAG